MSRSLLSQALGLKRKKKIPNRAQRRAAAGQLPSPVLLLRIYKARFAKWNAALRKEILDAYTPPARADAVREDSAEYIHKRIESFRVRVAQVFSKKELAPDLHPFADRVMRKGKEALVRVAGVDFRDIGLGDKVDAFIDENVALIQSVAGKQLDEMRDVVDDAVSRGVRVEELADSIQERFDVSESRAALIARDQTLKFNADIAQTRMEALGVEEYIWTTSGDERVRRAHEDLDGTTQRFDDPPITDEKTGDRNNPGGDFQCRCTSFPLLPELQAQDEES